MITPWIDNVRRRRRLYIYKSSLHQRWSRIYQQCIDEFNQLSTQHHLNVTFVNSNNSPTAGGGADVWVRTANGAVSFSYGGASKNTHFNGNGLHGYTGQIKRRMGSRLRIEKAYIFLPSNPQINTPNGVRNVGEGVMKVILVHELVHACGLTNADHTPNGLFNGYPFVDYGNTPEEDKVVVQGRRMPPLFLSSTTVNKIKTLW